MIEPYIDKKGRTFDNWIGSKSTSSFNALIKTRHRTTPRYTPIHRSCSAHRPLHEDNCSDNRHDHDIRNSRYVPQNLRDRTHIGKLDQSIELYLRGYNICPLQKNISYHQRADYFVKTLDSASLTLFFNNVEDEM